MNETVTISEPPILSRSSTVRLTTAQALVRYLAGLRVRVEGPHCDEIAPLFGRKITFTTNRLPSGF